MWYQNYNPLHYWQLSTLVATLPILTLFIALVAFKKSVWLSALCGLAVATIIALFVLYMPLHLFGLAAADGFIFGFLQIAWIIIGTIFTYNLALETGQFQIMKDSIASVTSDMRIQIILIAFCFGAFLEGACGGGAPVAIAGAFLIGLGFKPMQAAVVCLMANTAPVAWGAVGSPVRILTAVTGIPEFYFSSTIGRILPIFSLVLPIIIMLIATDWKKTKQVLPALILSGFAFASMQFFWSNFVEPGLVDIMSGLFTLVVMIIFMKFWKPKEILTTENYTYNSKSKHPPLTVLRAWSPFLFISVCIFLWSLPDFNRFLKFDSLIIQIPDLHLGVIRTLPIVSTPTPEKALLDLNLLSLQGTAVLVGAILCMPLIKIKPQRALQIFGHTFRQLLPSLAAISLMVSLGFVTRYAGLDAIIGLSLIRTGFFYPFFGTLLGWVGVAITGTDGGSNALFGNLQKMTAEQLGINPVLMGSANSAGGVMGKMISAQSIVVSSIATGSQGKEAEIFKKLFKYSLILAALIGIVVMLYAYVFQNAIPIYRD